jgi:hypothetical protein
MTLVLALLALSVCTTNAQNAARNWVFGRGAKISFVGNPPVPNASSVTTINTGEGSSAISDANGNLLFYTDGRTVWNKNNVQMPNGTGLLGNGSSTHSALIVPCNCDKYFVFTTDAAENQYANGLNYSVVDMTLNGGMGDVVATAKNIPLLAKASEKIAGVSDGLGGFWLVAHTMGDNRFFSYHITPNIDCRLNPQSARISAVGSIYSGGTAHFGQGQMKISPDGKLLAHAGLTYSIGSPQSFVELFGFNTTTGAVSNLGTPTARDTSDDGFYGVEFSPNSDVLYATTIVRNNFIYRYGNITVNKLTSRTTIHAFGNFQYTVAALQLAPDGKIYIARNNIASLFVLPAPDTANGGWTTTPFTLFNLAAGTNSRLGLPTVVAGQFSCGPTPDVCCDKMRVSPALNPPLNQDYRTFEIFNFKQPASPICSIDISMQPLPHTVTWQGGQASWVNSSGLLNPLPGNPSGFAFPYTRLPTTGNIAAFSVPVSAPAVKFNLGFDNTQAYNGVTKLTVNHCDGTKCLLEYKPWIVRVRGGDIADSFPWSVDIRAFSEELVELKLTYQGGRGRTALPQGGKGAKWLGLRLLDESAQVYATDGAEVADERGRKIDLSSSSKTSNAALFEFNGLLDLNNREQTGGTITLLVRKRGGAKIEPKEIRLTLYDENANPIMTGTPLVDGRGTPTR